MRINLVLAPAIFKRAPLIGLAYLSAYLRKKGHEVSVIDLNAELPWPEQDNEIRWLDAGFIERVAAEKEELADSLADRILGNDPGIIGFSAWVSTKNFSLALAGKIKRKDPRRVIVLGGPECSFSPEELIGHNAIDAIIMGEGEETLAELASGYESGDGLRACAGSKIKINNDIVDGGQRKEMRDLDSLPFPDYSDFNFDNYINKNTLPMVFYRGCLRRCVFCNTSVTWKTFRSRSAGNIFEEMIYHTGRFPGLAKFDVDDTAINLDTVVISELCDLIIANGFKINWGGMALIREEMTGGLLKKMAKAGCNCMGYGLESGSQKIIDSIGKGFRIDTAERVIRDTYGAGIETILAIIIGFPGETEKDFEDTLKFIQRNRDFISWIHSPSECCIGCNSFMQNNPDKFGAVIDPENGENWRSVDGYNNHDMRQKRIRIFNEFLVSIGVRRSSYSNVHKNVSDQ
ncbi:MAG: radical SAM protein [Candidatus Omnitrophota bacterium]|jgi:radical SAM superfamily enzyme YgiQ (UPF0313 family)